MASISYTDERNQSMTIRNQSISREGRDDESATTTTTTSVHQERNIVAIVPVLTRPRLVNHTPGHPDSARLKLVRERAIHVKQFIAKQSLQSDCFQAPVSTPNFAIIAQFGQHPLHSHVSLVLHGYVNHGDIALDYRVPSGILSICQQYLFAEHDAVCQLAYTLFVLLRKVNRTTVPHEMLPALIRTYLKETDTAKVQSYCTQLVRLNYLKPLGFDSETAQTVSYCFPIEAELVFGQYAKHCRRS